METMSESEALNDQCDWGAEDDFRDEQQEKYFRNVYAMQSRYADNAVSPIKSTIRCACCNKRIIKRNYQTQFCSNKGAGNCKDKYWNNTSEKRRARAKFFA